MSDFKSKVAQGEVDYEDGVLLSEKSASLLIPDHYNDLNMKFLDKNSKIKSLKLEDFPVKNGDNVFYGIAYKMKTNDFVAIKKLMLLK